jgi:uncharacterized protein with PIN domain
MKDINCPECKNELRFIESVYSNYNSGRAVKGEHTGDVYRCDTCEETYLDDFLINQLYVWHYDN